MIEAVPEPIFPEDDPYPAYRVPAPIVTTPAQRSPIDDYVLSALVATGTLLVPRKSVARRSTEV